ncbi:MAG: 4Fe-4S dicluster domain-containing protein [Coriobacteriia bacterium]|nr:4Fe-4S dicluster domain-containing protein [Coriobacteriia bacterium]
MSRMFNEKERRIPLGIFLSLRIAFKNLFRRPITVQYPKERLEIPQRARWAVEINYASEDGTHRCTACRVCEKECPDDLIEIDITVAEDRSRHINRWLYRRGGCMMCGLCVEVCPFCAIKMAHDYELAHVDPELLELDLLVDVPAYRRPKKPRPATAAKKEASDA